MINFAEQFQGGAGAAGDLKINGHFDRFVFCGMGGSAIPGEIISMLWLTRQNFSTNAEGILQGQSKNLGGLNGLNCYINRGYGLPDWINDKCLVICTSWSGNTEETVSSFKAAVDRGLPVAVVADKGELLDLAKSSNKPYVDLPAQAGLPSADLPARFVVGQMLAAILTLLKNSASIDYILPAEVDSSPADIDFSSKISNKLPLIYSSYQWRYLARFWKIHFNENCKIHAFSNFFPEATHNEISAFTSTQENNCFPIILIDKEDYPEDVGKLQKFAVFLKDQNIEHKIVYIEGRDRLEKIIKNYNHAISVSVALARVKGVEPFDTSVIEKFKKI